MYDDGFTAGAARPGAHRPIDPFCTDMVHHEVSGVLRAQRPSAGILRMIRPNVDSVAASVVEDLVALTTRDPAAHGLSWHVLESYAAFRAVLAYRLAHTVYRESLTCGPRTAERLLTMARRISEEAKVATGVEIHPAAAIGRRFVLDHGTGTVIGETTVIGDDCYMLQGVILGAGGIAHNKSGKRHPTIGNRVQIGAFARVLGPVRIGDDAFIGPGTVLTTDVCDGSYVRTTNQCQVSRPTGLATVFGVVPLSPSEIEIHGTALKDARVELVDANNRPAGHIAIDVVDTTDRNIVCRIGGDTIPVDESVLLTEPTGAELRITQLQPVWRYMRTLRPNLVAS